jgi:hypothetical protein
VTSADGRGYRTVARASRRSVQTGSAEVGSGTKAAWAVVRFSEAKRTFDTGNIVKWVGDVQGVKGSLSRGERSTGARSAKGTGRNEY